MEWAKNSPNPSSSAKRLQTSSKQDSNHIYSGRNGHEGLPITLYHPVFAQFQDDLVNTMRFSPEHLRCIEGLGHGSVAFHLKESDHMKTLEPPLKFLLGTDLTTVIACSGVKCDGTVMALSACWSEKGWVMLVEVKNEVRTGRCDPSIQASEAYPKYWTDVCCKSNME